MSCLLQCTHAGRGLEGGVVERLQAMRSSLNSLAAAITCQEAKVGGNQAGGRTGRLLFVLCCTYQEGVCACVCVWGGGTLTQHWSPLQCAACYCPEHT